jgi:hypothetical protein
MYPYNQQIYTFFGKDFAGSGKTVYICTPETEKIPH